MPRPRRIGRWIVISGFCVSIVLAICVGLWVWLPYFAPDWVIRHSPWLEPVVRVRMYHAWAFKGGYDNMILNPDPRLYDERMESWGPTLPRDLAPLLHGTTAMREATLETYPLQAPRAAKLPYFRTQKDWERVVVNVKPITDEDRVWFLARIGGRAYDLGDALAQDFGQIRMVFDRERSSMECTAHPRLPDRSIVKIRLELRMDFHVPFWLVDRVIQAACQRSGKAGEQDVAYMDATVSEGTSHQEGLLCATSLPAPTDAHVITLVPHSTSSSDAGVDVLVDGRSAIFVDGPLNSRARHDGIVRAIERGLPAAPDRRHAMCVGGGPLTPWGDVVAGLDGARIANSMTGDEWKTEGSDDPKTRKSLTIAPVFTGH